MENIELPNTDLSNFLLELSHYYQLDNDAYRSKVFKEAAEKISIYPDKIISGVDAKSKIGYGVGKSTIEEIDYFIQTCSSPRLDELKKKYVERESIINEFMKLHGVGIVNANKFYNQGYRTVDQLWSNPDLTDAMKLSIYYRKHLELRIPRSEIDLINQSFKNMFPQLNFEIVGSYRRQEPDSGDIDILIKNNGISLFDIVKTLKGYDTISGDLALGDSKYLGLFHLPNGITRRLDLLLIDPNSWGSALLYFTGSQQFNILMRQRAKDLGYRLNEYGLYNESGNKIDTYTEEDIFKILGIKYLQPIERTRNITSLPFI